MVPTGYWSLPVVHEAGHDAAMVVLTLLIDAGRWGAAKALPPECLRPKRLAVATGLAVRDGLSAAAATIETALADALAAGLLVDDGGAVWFGPGLWVERADVRRKLRADAERKRQQSAAKRAGSGRGKAETAPAVAESDRIRPESVQNPSYREEESREENAPPAPPMGGAAADDLAEQVERLESSTAAMAAVDRGGVADAFRHLCDEFARRGGVSDRGRMQLVDALSRESTATIRHLTALVSRGTDHVRSPAGYIASTAGRDKSMLDEAREMAQADLALAAVEAERKAARDERERVAAEHERRMRDDPEYRAERAAAAGRFAAVLAELGGAS